VGGEAEPATGLTLFPDAVLRAVSPRTARQRLYVPLGADQDDAARLRRLGYATIAGLGPERDPVGEARRLECSHILRNGTAVPISSGA
jgi:ATP phosphoribosyltransferase regulatory subunit